MAEYDRITLRVFQAQTHDTMNCAAFRAAAAPAALVSMPCSALAEEVVGSAFPPLKKSCPGRTLGSYWARTTETTAQGGSVHW